MRSLTYVQPGETTSCIGCHEHRCQAPANTDALALRRPPSRLDPGPFGGRPFAFASVVQPVLDEHCTKCHGGERPKARIDLTGAPAHGFSRSYVSLVNRKAGGKGALLVPRFRARNQLQLTPPGGPWGSRGSGLLGMLRKGHNKVRLAPDELARLALWLDLNAIFYGVHEPDAQARQLAAHPVPMPPIQ